MHHGQRAELHECACGKVCHHMCAGKVNHTKLAACFECSREEKTSQVPQSDSSNNTDVIAFMETAFDRNLRQHADVDALFIGISPTIAIGVRFRRTQNTFRSEEVRAYIARYWAKKGSSIPELVFANSGQFASLNFGAWCGYASAEGTLCVHGNPILKP